MVLKLISNSSCLVYKCVTFYRYRAEVLQLKVSSDEKVATLYFVDYGDTDDVACKDLYELRTDLLRLHFQAIECFLARIGITINF